MVLRFQMNCQKQEIPEGDCEVHLISGIQKQNYSLSGLKMYQGDIFNSSSAIAVKC